ncbi:MAG TPA: hypothetical protein VFO85_02395, partial [Vicinamibacteria bacterium]|nr:hypothetical protein [Vicinamibacteria bacterium]
MAAPDQRPRRRVRLFGAGLLVALWLPLLLAAGIAGYLWIQGSRARAGAERARGAVGVGSSLGEAILAAAEPVGPGRALPCIDVSCLVPPGFVLRNGATGWFGVVGPDGLALAAASREELRDALRGVTCRRVQVAYCGRP